MSIPPCFFLQADVFPAAKAEASRQLLGQGWRQQRIADTLAISQTMVSRYARQPESDDPLIRRLAADVLAQVQGEARTDTTWCDTLAKPAGRDPDRAVLASLLLAEHLLRESPPLAVMPQVGLNIAMALPNAKAPEDVMAYPGRFMAAANGLVGGGPPALGASAHLASILLHIQASYPEIRAIANVKGGRHLDRRVEALGTTWKLEGGEGDRADQVESQVRKRRKQPSFIQDPGGFGMEPCLYILGTDAVACVDAIRAIAMHAD